MVLGVGTAGGGVYRLCATKISAVGVSSQTVFSFTKVTPV